MLDRVMDPSVATSDLLAWSAADSGRCWRWDGGGISIRGGGSGILDRAARFRVFADDWEQASHNGDLAHADAGGALGREDVEELGDVLAGYAPGRQSPDDITVFDSTGLAIQDLAIALAARETADDLDLPTLALQPAGA